MYGQSDMETYITVCKTDAAAVAAKSLRSCPTVRPHRRKPTWLLRPWDSPGKSTRVGCIK